MEKRIIWLAVSLMIFVCSLAHAFVLRVEYDTDRPGCDYKSFPVPGANDPRTFYNVCLDSCAADSSCHAWNFDPRSGTPMCFLKNCAPLPTAAKGTVGGVKYSAIMSENEDKIDRPGCDYKNFVTNVPDVCVSACGIDSSCQAWNLDGRSGTNTCFLKNCVPAPTLTNDGRVIGGVKYSFPP
jgi:hypothetical protein